MLTVVALLMAAQTSTSTQADAAERIENVVVTASRVTEKADRTPYSTSVLGISEILNGRPTLSLAEALSQVPGVFVTSRFNFTQDTRLSIRGFGARSAFGIRGVRVLLDGIPLTLPDGQSQVDSIDMAAISRIGVLRGPAGSLYGNAAGGVLVLSTAPLNGESTITVNQTVGAFELLKTSVLAHTTVDNTRLTLFGSRTRIEGARENAAAEQVVAMARAETMLSDRVLLSSQVHYVRAPQAQDPGGITREQLDDDPSQAAANNLRFRTGEDLSQVQFGARLVAELNASHRLELVGHAGLRTFEGNIPFRVIEFDRNFYGGQLIYRHQSDLTPHVAWRSAVGAEIQGQSDRRRNEGNDDGRPNGEVSLNQQEQAIAFGAYTQQQLSFGSLLVLGSIRYDHIDFEVFDRLIEDGDTSGSRAFDQMTAQGGLQYQLLPSLALFANVAQSFETPTFSELVNSGPDAGLSAQLDAQRALSLEAGVRGQGAAFSFEATAFRIGLDNELLAAEDEQNRAIFTNAGRSERVGVEIFGRWQVLESLEVRAAYSFLRATFGDEGADSERQGNLIPGLPEHRIFARARWAQDGLHVAAEIEWVGRRFADDANEARAGAYTLGEIRAGSTFNIGTSLTADLSFGIRNLFDVTYADNIRINGFGGRFFEGGPPQHVFGTFTLQWQDPASAR
ncbi:MAG: TonB-dependent receptor [Myxococcota bacterium]